MIFFTYFKFHKIQLAFLALMVHIPLMGMTTLSSPQPMTQENEKNNFTFYQDGDDFEKKQEEKQIDTQRREDAIWEKRRLDIKRNNALWEQRRLDTKRDDARRDQKRWEQQHRR